jgi:hypothetical protein
VTRVSRSAGLQAGNKNERFTTEITEDTEKRGFFLCDLRALCGESAFDAGRNAGATTTKLG